MQPNVLKTLLILLEMREAIRTLLKMSYKGPALLNIYAFIDICASLAAESKMKNNLTFKTYITKYFKPGELQYSVDVLWAARCSIIHSLSPFGDQTNKVNSVSPIFYYSYPEKREEVESLIKSRGYQNYILANVEDIHDVAITTFNSFYKRIEDDPVFEKIVIANAEHILANVHYYLLEEELTLMDKITDLTKKSIDGPVGFNKSITN